MRPAIKLSSIDQEHLQELYNDAKIARDELPYTETFDQIVQGFQDRTFKNAHPEQLFAALLKYTRSSTNAAAAEAIEVNLTEDQLKQIKALLPRHARSGKIMPYSDEFDAANKEFNKLAGVEVAPGDFWRAMLRTQGPKRRPPKARAKVAVPSDADDDVD